MKPSFDQVLGYIQEGEPLALDLPKRNASIYTSSHFYLDNFPNASEPLSDAPMPHTTLNPAAAFETADEGYEESPSLGRPENSRGRPSCPLRNDGLNPPRPPTLGGRMRESGIQAAEAIVAGGAAGAAAAVRSVSENQTLASAGAAPALDSEITRLSRSPDIMQYLAPLQTPPTAQQPWRPDGKGGRKGKDKDGKGNKGAARTPLELPEGCVTKDDSNQPLCFAFNTHGCKNQCKKGRCMKGYHKCWRKGCFGNHSYRTALGSGAPAAERGAAGGGGGARGGAGHRELRFAAARGSGSIGGLRHCCRGSGGSSGSGNRGRGRYGSFGAAGRGSPGDGGHGGCCGWRPGAALIGTAWAIEGGLNAASHLMGWGAATGGGTDSDASRPSMTTDVQSLNGMQESGAVDHYFIQEQRRAQRSQDRHGVGERAQESAAATDPKPPGEASEATGANPLRPEQRSHPRVLRQRTVPGQPPVPRRAGTPRNPAVLRRPSSGERTGSCIR